MSTCGIIQKLVPAPPTDLYSHVAPLWAKDVGFNCTITGTLWNTFYFNIRTVQQSIKQQKTDGPLSVVVC